MKNRYFTILFLAIFPLLACNFATQLLRQKGNDEIQPTEPGPVAEAPTSSIRISISPDVERAVEAAIPVEGGSLSATGADGTVYQLDIPGDALLNETVIRLTPLASISGMPFGGAQTYAVHMAPEGLFLQNFAILTITPPQEIPVDQQILFSYQGDGESLALALPVIDSPEVKIQVLHFSGYGVTDGSLSEVAPVRSSLGGDADGRIESSAAEEAQSRRQGSNSEGINFEEAYKKYKEEVLQPRINAAGESCEAGQLANETILGAMRQASLLGTQEIYDELYEELLKLVPIVAENCMKEEYELCQDDHVIQRILPFYLGWNRQYSLMFEGMPEMQALDKRLQKYVEQCLRFEVVFESTAFNGTTEDGFETRVIATVPMNFSFDGGWKYVGQAPLVNDAFAYYYEYEGCTSIANRGGGTFEAPQLRFSVEYASPDDQTGRVSQLFLDYFPGETSEEFGYICEDHSFGPAIAPLWTGLYIAAHEADANPEVGFTVADWEIFGDEYYAKKEWQIDLPDLELVEIGSFKLYHKPGG